MISASHKGMHIVLYLIMTDTCVEVQYVKSYCVLELERGGGAIFMLILMNKCMLKASLIQQTYNACEKFCCIEIISMIFLKSTYTLIVTFLFFLNIK